MKIFKNKKVLSVLLFFVPMLIGIPIAMYLFPSNINNSTTHNQKQDTWINQQLKSNKKIDDIEEKLGNILNEIENLKMDIKKIELYKDSIFVRQKTIEVKKQLPKSKTK